MSFGYMGTRGDDCLECTVSTRKPQLSCLQVRQSWVGLRVVVRVARTNLRSGERTWFMEHVVISVTSGHTWPGLLELGRLNDDIASFANSNYNAFQVRVSRTVGSLDVLGAIRGRSRLHNDSDTLPSGSLQPIHHSPCRLST